MPPSKSRALVNRFKKKRKFYGKRKATEDISVNDNNVPSGSFLDDPEPSTSTPKKTTITCTAKKFLNSSLDKIHETGIITRSSAAKIGLSKLKKKRETAAGYSIMDMSLLQNALQCSAICSSCKSTNSKLNVLKDSTRRHGLAKSIIIKCSQCLQETKFYTSKKLEKGRFEVKTRSVASCNSLKGGRTILSGFCGIMNLPPPLATASYSKHLKTTSQVAREEAEKQMKEAAERIRKQILNSKPDADQHDKDGAIPVAVSVDGTWHKRGYSSKYGVVLAILVDTGEVVDLEVLSTHCHECRKNLHLNKESDAFKTWKEKHEPVCQINVEGSSGGMEGAGAAKIFKRSIKKRGLKYVTFVGDGDSDTFKVVKDEIEKVYGTRYPVKKEECIGHIQKRMGNALRNLLKDMKGKKMSDNKTIGGRGRLTKDRIDSIQRFYGNAIRANCGYLMKMQNAIWAIFYHMIMPVNNISLKEQHKFCPKGNLSWCKFNSDLETGKQTYEESSRLPSSFYDLLKPIFKRLTSSDLLIKCQKGLTQNANESLNHLIWERCPKTTFCSKNRIISAVSEAVCCFNTGAGSKALILKAAGIKDLGENTLKELRKEDNSRHKSASQKVSQKYRRWRLNKIRTKKLSRSTLKKHYDPGAFDSMGERSSSLKRRGKPAVGKSKKQKLDQKPGEPSSSIVETTTDVSIEMALPLAYIRPI